MAPQKLRVIPLGGLGEVGKNMLALEYRDDILVIDAGLMFPTEEMLGVDVLIPDIGYLLQRQENIKGIIVTHGHEDHIGALPYILPRLDVPVYSTALTRKLIQIKLKQRGVKSKGKLNLVQAGGRISLGSFTVEFFPVCHSIPDSVGLAIRTPVGVVVHSGDFKLDHTPILSQPTDLSRLANLGTKGVLLLLGDSTYAELGGYTPSERIVTETLDHIVGSAEGRVIITTFSSLIARIQQVFDVATRHNRRVYVTGRSMEDIVSVGLEDGYLKAPAKLLCNYDELRRLPANQVVVLTTGSQGEPTSALVRMANRDHSQIQILAGDTVVMSATPVPGNEGLVNRTIDSLFRQGANVIYGRLSDVHVHGHGSQEELKLLFNLVKPKYFVPVHGEYRHLRVHTQLVQSLGMPQENTFTLEDGDILELGQEGGQVTGRLPLGDVYVNGLVTGELDSTVLRDRRLLSRDGVVVATVALDGKTRQLLDKPQVTGRGFVDTEDNQYLMEKSRDVVASALRDNRKKLSEQSFVEAKIRNSLTRFFQEQVHRRPVIIPVVVEAGDSSSGNGQTHKKKRGRPVLRSLHLGK